MGGLAVFSEVIREDISEEVICKQIPERARKQAIRIS